MGMIKGWFHGAIVLALGFCPITPSFAQKNVIKIGIALPFHGGMGKPNKLSDAMLDYYAGLKIAFSELELEGFNAEVSVWDTEPNDSIPLNQLALESIVSSPNFANRDVVIGPVYGKNFTDLIANIQKNNTPYPKLWISPLTYITPIEVKENGIAKNTDSNDTNTHNISSFYPNVNFFIPDSLRFKALANAVAGQFSTYRICLIVDGSTPSKAKSNVYKSIIGKTHASTVSIHTWTNGKLTPTLPNRDSLILAVCIESADERIGLGKLLKNRASSWIIGDLSWFEDKQFYPGINDEFCLFPTVNFVDFHNADCIDFTRNYFNSEHSEPSKYAFIGYDHGVFLAYGIMAFGNNFIVSLPDATYEGLINNINVKSGKKSHYNYGIRFVLIPDETPHLFEQ
ncbi:MAG: hypothetical protein CK532_04785 [Flavobacteriales bacterium]|nr:MAG: hypothetical protein CK532_04785 [Flavobacteriales bacterium]